MSTLNQHFGQLPGIADSADAAQTTQASRVYAELTAELNSLLRHWDDLKQTEVPKLNSELQKADLMSIDPSKPLDRDISQAADGDDEP